MSQELPPLPEPTWNTRENYNLLHDDLITAGSFRVALIRAFFKADNINKAKLVMAFPSLDMTKRNNV
tara:strand:- start:234 stop:434 length:201 start_codon:yes stop_codon:yes gene_type:complete